MFWERYCDLCKKFNSSPNGVAKNIGVSNAICTKWKNGVIPKGDILLKIADFFGCSVDYLLDRTDNPQAQKANNVSVGNVSSNNGAIGVGNTVTNNTTPLDEHQKLLLDLYNRLSPTEQMDLLSSLSSGKNIFSKTEQAAIYYHVSSSIKENQVLKMKTKRLAYFCDIVWAFDTSSLYNCETLLNILNNLNAEEQTHRHNSKWLCEAIFEYIRKTEFPNDPSRVWGVFVVPTYEEAVEFKSKYRAEKANIFEIIQSPENVFRYDMGFFDIAHKPIEEGLNIDTFINACEAARRYWKHEISSENPFFEYIIDGTHDIQVGKKV